jgi:hypothetical protein
LWRNIALPHHCNSVRAEQKISELRYNASMFDASASSLNIASALMAGKVARATISKTTTIKG